MDFTLGSIYSIFHLQLSISTLVTLFNRGPLKEDARTKNHDSWCPTSYHEQYLDSTTKNGRLNSSEMDGGTFLVWKILIHDEIQVTSSNICSPCSIVDIPFFSPQNPAAEAINIPWIMVFKHAFTIPTAGKWWSHSLPGEKSCNASQPHTTAGMMEPAIDWASWRSPSHKTHLPKTCPKIRKKHMTSTWVSVSPFVEETKINGSTHPISQKKTIPKHLFRVFMRLSSSKNTKFLAIPHHIEHRTQRDNLPMPQVSDFDESNEIPTGRIPTTYHGNSMK